MSERRAPSLGRGDSLAFDGRHARGGHFFVLHLTAAMNDLDTLVQAAQSAFDAAPTPADLENAKARFLGKAGQLTELMKGLAALSVEQKKTPRRRHQRRPSSASKRCCRRAAMRWPQAELQAQLQAEALDVTLPGRRRGTGGLHPVSRTMRAHRGHLRARWASTWPTAPRSRPTGTASPR